MLLSVDDPFEQSFHCLCAPSTMEKEKRDDFD